MDGSNLTANGQKELQSYLNFFNLKKQDAMKEVDLEFRDFENHSVLDTLYNKEDVIELINKLKSNIGLLLNQEISKIIYMGGVYAKIFLSVCADRDFHADFNFIENIKIIEQMKILEKGGTIVDNQQASNVAKYARLPTLDIGLQKQQEELIKEVEFLRGQNVKLQNELVQIKKEQMDQVNTGTDQITYLQKENEQLKAEMEKKLHDSVQFKNLKQMIQEKNQQIKELQMKLQ